LKGFTFFDFSVLGVDFERRPEGVGVKEPRKGGQFDRAGFRAGDVLTRIDGRTVTGIVELQQALRRDIVGLEKATCRVLRDGRPVMIDAWLHE
jgi:S1-C subfamily serine protease